MILSAGLGTRLKPFTNYHPKALAKVNGKSLLQRNIEYLMAYEIKDIIINVHHFPLQILDELSINKNWGASITISDESDEVLETGGGLKKASWFFEVDPSSFVLINVDILIDLNLNKMIEWHYKTKALSTLALSDRKTSRYFLFDEDLNLSGWENTMTGERKISRHVTPFIRKAFSGLHIIHPDIFNFMRQSGKYSMVDVYLDLCRNNTIKGFEQKDSRFIDVGKPESIALAETMFQ